MRGKILHPIRAAPRCADYDEIADQRSHQRHIRSAAALSPLRFYHDRAGRKKHRRAQTGSHEWINELIQPAKEAGFETFETSENH
jgi:hypothetical protein